MENNINCTNINFRSKFSKHIQCEPEHDVFVSAFNKFIALDKNSAIEMIWQMSFDPCSEELWKIVLDPESIPEEMYAALRGELRHHYEKIHRPSDKDSILFWTGTSEIAEDEKAQLMEFSGQTNIVVAAVVYNKCLNYILRKSLENIERVVFLLNANKEQLHYGGLCELRFEPQEANYLKAFHKQIHNLFNVMFENRKNQKVEMTQKPFANLAQQIESTGKDLPFTFGPEDNDESPVNPLDEIQEEVLPEEIPVEEPTVCVPKFISITAENVLENKAVFSAFAINRDMSGLIHLNQLGFDLNQVVAKEAAITNLLKAAEALNN